MFVSNSLILVLRLAPFGKQKFLNSIDAMTKPTGRSSQICESAQKPKEIERVQSFSEIRPLAWSCVCFSLSIRLLHPRNNDKGFYEIWHGTDVLEVVHTSWFMAKIARRYVHLTLRPTHISGRNRSLTCWIFIGEKMFRKRFTEKEIVTRLLPGRPTYRGSILSLDRQTDRQTFPSLHYPHHLSVPPSIVFREWRGQEMKANILLHLMRIRTELYLYNADKNGAVPL
jgi:hypothetical protein